MLEKRARIFCKLLLLSCLSACTQTESAQREVPHVLATTTMIAEAAERIGEECVVVRGLLPVGGDPHVYEPVPQDARAVAESDLVLYNGFGLEGWLDRLIRNVGGERPIVEVAEGLTPIYGQYAGGRDPDPHLWGDVSNFIHYVESIRDALVQQAPACETTLRANADAYIQELQALDGWVRERTATIPPQNRQLVTSHDAFQYYASAYGLNVLGTPIGVSTDEEASAQTVARIVEDVRRTRVPALFVETTVNPNIIRRIASETGAGIGGSLYSDSLGEPGSGAESYVGMIVHNTRTIVRALGGSAEPFVHAGQSYTGGVEG
ncbi:zinc ABC transporter substrate-binding protein [soil metagenome]|jgi:manganese/iron transport system substrate-binding protein